METTQTTNSPSFETVWATLDRIAKRQEETDRLLEETFRGIEELKESQKETERIIKESAVDSNRRLGELTNRFGEIVEYMVAPKLCEKFLEFGLDFPRVNPGSYVNDRVNKIFLEIDVMLENGDKAMLVEVKTNLTTERINKHISRLEKMRKYADLHGDRRTFLGAVAGVVVTDEARDYALNEGLYLIEPSGENFNITPPNGKPKEW